MLNENNLNPAKGRAFKEAAAKAITEYFGVEFELDIPIAIGSPPKDHRFSLVSINGKYAGESKNFSWTEGGNVPSAKMGFINQAVFYLSFLPSDLTKFIILRKDVHPKKGESIATYYYRTYRHLLNGVLILELDMDLGIIKICNEDIS